MSYHLTSSSYGKSKVRLTKVVRKTPVHELFEFDVAVELSGDFQPAYTHGNNQNVIATDTIKNTVYVLAKENDFDSAEEFAMILVNHFIKTYQQVTFAQVTITQPSWQRITIDGKPHDHAFTNAGTQLRYVKATQKCSDASCALFGGVRDMLVLKTTASEWADFHADRYRTLKDTHDRILSTRIDADWLYGWHQINFDVTREKIINAILQTFATHHSLGVQQTLLVMGEAVLEACHAIDWISFEMPNMHRIPFNLEPFGLKFENDIFVATDEPHGVIKGTVSRTK